MAEMEHKYLYLREDIHPPVYVPGIPDGDFRNQLITWHRGLDSEQRILYTMLQGQVHGLLGVNSHREIRQLFDQPELKQRASNRFLDQLGLLYNIKGRERIKQKCEEYGECADILRDKLQSNVSYEGSANLEMVNEIRSFNHPFDLLMLTLDGTWGGQARWDAKVKLQLISLAGAVDRRQREIGIEDQFKRFVGWMNEQVWNPNLLKGDPRGAYLISTHDPQTWSCSNTQWVDEDEGFKKELQPFQKKNHLPRRNFITASGRVVDIYVTTRDKPLDTKVEKMLRKRAEDPAIAVDDDTGFLAVVNNIRDAKDFISHLTDRGYKSDNPISIEDVSYTLNGKEYKGNHGSSSQVRMIKFFIRFASKMRIECIVHTPESYAESLYKKGVSHAEYRVNRLFDAGIPGLIFPPKYFPRYDPVEAKRRNLVQVRRDIENSDYIVDHSHFVL